MKNRYSIDRYIDDVEQNLKKNDSRVMVNLFNSGVMVDLKPIALAAIQSIKRIKRRNFNIKNR